MSVQILGERTVGECIPSMLSVNARLLADVQAKIAAAIALQARITLTPPTLTASLTAALALVARLQASIALGLPSVSLDLTAMLKVIASLQVDLQAALAINVAFGTGGIAALSYEGPIGSMGGELTGALETLFPPTNEALGLVLIASEPASRAALQLVFGIG